MLYFNKKLMQIKRDKKLQEAYDRADKAIKELFFVKREAWKKKS